MAKAKKGQHPPAGEIRQSQILTTFGPGSMVDLPNRSVLIGGLNHWQGHSAQPIREERLAQRLEEILDVKGIKLYAPPTSDRDPSAPRTGITAFTFPTWYLAQVEETYRNEAGKEYRTRPLVPWKQLSSGRYLSEDRKRKPVVPVRFVQACRNGHISDIDWPAFVSPECDLRCPLWLDESGSGNDFAEIFVRCSRHKKRRPLSDAKIPGRPALGYCKGHRPWLGDNAAEPCKSKDSGKSELNRLLVRSASNAYFSQTLSVISLPDSDEALRQAVDRVYEDFLQYAENVEDVKRDRKKMKVAAAIDGFSDETVWAEIERRKRGVEPASKTIKQVEIETLMSCPGEIGEDAPEGDFYARTHSLDGFSQAWLNKLDRIVLVHRLREVIAQVGFTRFEPSMPDVDEDLDMNVARAALDIEPTWLPAVENRGEGVFIAFRADAIAQWLSKPAVEQRGRSLAQGFEDWKQRRGYPDAKFPGLPYIMLHSFSHLLLTAVTLECGYSASSIRERIYAGESGYGILLYTGTQGSEGTLGGLVAVGKHLETHLQKALELGRLCSNDPVCAQHQPSRVQEERYLHGAACHGCLLIAEPSCERRNEFLDRALVVDTVASSGAAFFGEAIT